MYDQFYGLDYDPFRLTPSGRDVFAHPSFERARAYLEYGLMRGEGFVVITGPPGSGKTTLARELVGRLPSATRWAQIETSRLEPLDLLRLVVARFGITPTASDKAALIEGLRGELSRHAAAGGRTVLIVDEAQGLPPESLEELRMLTNLVGADNQPLLQIVLLGQPGLRELINRPELEQLHQRTVASCRLEPLTEDQAVEFIGFRLRQAGWRGDPWITMAALQLLHTAAEGIPRRLNLLASRLMLHGFADAKHRLTIDDAIGVLEEMADESVANWRSRVDELRRVEGQERGPEQPAPRLGPQEPEPRENSVEATLTEAAAPAPPRSPEPATGPAAEPSPQPEPTPRDEPEAEEDLVIQGPADAPGRSRAERLATRESAPPIRRARRPNRGRSAAVIISIIVAVIALSMVVMAATPVGQTLEARFQTWVESLRSNDGSHDSGASSGGLTELSPFTGESPD